MTKQDANSTLMKILMAADFTPGTGTPQTSSRRHSPHINPFTFTRNSELEQKSARRQITVDTIGGQSLISRRPQALRLEPLMISESGGSSGRRVADVLDWREGMKDGGDVVEEGKELFSQFVYQQAGTEEYAEAVERLGILTPASHHNQRLRQIGHELRHIADSLTHSRLRRRVKKRASMVTPNTTRAEFRTMLKELFAGGITQERIVVVFLFCSDVALGWLGNGGWEMCGQILQWSLAFISKSVCAWVQSHGGWNQVMRSRFNALSVSLALAGVILVGLGVITYVTTS